MDLRRKAWLVVMCAVVILFATSVEASHFHSDALPDAPFSKPFSKKNTGSCLICSALHAPALSAPIALFGTTVATAAQSVPEIPKAPKLLEAFGLFVRPPPNMA
jgi:hypothetical protein